MFRISNHITKNQLITISAYENEPCISIYLPYNDSFHPEKSKTHFKNALQSVTKKLERYNISQKEKQLLLSELNNLLHERSFWEVRGAGTVILIKKNFFHIYRFDCDFKAINIVDKRFYIRPLLLLYHNGEIRNVALLNMDDIHLLRFEKGQKNDILLPDELSSFEVFMKHHDFEKHQQFHTKESQGRAMYHGQGNKEDKSNMKAYQEEYFKAFKNWIAPQMQKDETLYLVGDEQSTGLFKKAADNSFKTHVLLQKNTHSVEEAEIIMKMIGKEQEKTQKAKEKALDELSESKSSVPVLYSIEEIIPAAFNKRIDKLFLPASNNNIWGHCDPREQKVEIEKGQDNSLGEELINMAAAKTLQNGGTVLLIDSPKKQNTPRFAAICRW